MRAEDGKNAEDGTRSVRSVRSVCHKIIRVIRVIRVQNSSCSKHLVRASKFIIGQFHIAASRNNSTFNIQKSKLRSAPPCANKYSFNSDYSCSKTVSAPLRTISVRSVRSVCQINIRHSCSKHLVRASKFIIDQFYIAASRNNMMPKYKIF